MVMLDLTMRLAPTFLKLVFWLILLLLPLSDALAQSGDEDLIDRPISQVVLRGLDRVTEQKVLNNLRSAAGEPYTPQTTELDISNLTRLGDFKFISASASLQPDGTVVVYFDFTEQAMIQEIAFVGNKVFTGQELLSSIRLVRGGPRDDFLIENAKRKIESMYREQGYYMTTVSVDDKELDTNAVLIFEIIEGPRVRVKAVEFEGNTSFTDGVLDSEVVTRTAIPFFRRGELDESQLLEDVTNLTAFYRDRGYLDVRVDRRVQISSDNSEAKVTFMISEGPLYTLRDLQVINLLEGDEVEVFTPEQIKAIVPLKKGNVFTAPAVRESVDAVEEAYGLLGYLEIDVQASDLRSSDEPVVDLLLEVTEGPPSTVGVVKINGNFLTKDKVIRRLVHLRPGRRIDATQVKRSRQRVLDTQLFNDVRITIQDPRSDQSGHRDVLVEVKERNTGSFNFGVAFGTDSGVFGDFSLNQNNFDIADYPRSFEELWAGRAFRGAGQQFSMVFQPGNEIFNYEVSLYEPHFLETNWGLDTSGFFRRRQFRDYWENRIGGQIGVGHKLGEVWSGSIAAKIEEVQLSQIDNDVPQEIYDDRGPDLLTGLTLALSRTTVDSIFRPSEGGKLNLYLSQFGGIGDVTFSRVQAEYTVFFTVDEDFLGRRSTMRLRGRVGYIFGGKAPTYEKFYLGGRTLRGFAYRQVSPKGTNRQNGNQTDIPVGGDWMFFLGAQYQFPLFGEAVDGVAFVDSGTVTNDISVDPYRASIGVGIRLFLPMFGPAPLAFDFAIPFLQGPDDETQVFSFSAELPF